MSELNLSDNLIQRIQAIAERENRSVEVLLTRMIQQYAPPKPALPADAIPEPDPLLGLICLLDDQVDETDLSSSVRKTLTDYTHPKYGWTKRGRTD